MHDRYIQPCNCPRCLMIIERGSNLGTFKLVQNRNSTTVKNKRQEILRVCDGPRWFDTPFIVHFSVLQECSLRSVIHLPLQAVALCETLVEECARLLLYTQNYLGTPPPVYSNSEFSNQLHLPETWSIELSTSPR
jgi:hypothetical protein